MRSLRQGPTVLFLTGMLLAACWFGPVQADDLPRASTPDEDAARLVEEVLRKAGGNGADSLGEWTREVVEGALDRAGGAARRTGPGENDSAVPLPAERHASALTGPRSGAAEVLIFTSLSVPAASWRQWAHDAARIGAPLVLRGVSEDGLPATAKEIGERLGGAEAGVAIDPRLFRLFGVERVPAVVVVPGGVPPCRSPGCADPGPGGAGPGLRAGAGYPAPAHDRITGNIGLAAALHAIADEGAVGRNAARGHLRRLRGEDRP